MTSDASCLFVHQRFVLLCSCCSSRHPQSIALVLSLMDLGLSSAFRGVVEFHRAALEAVGCSEAEAGRTALLDSDAIALLDMLLLVG